MMQISKTGKAFHQSVAHASGEYCYYVASVIKVDCILI